MIMLSSLLYNGHSSDLCPWNEVWDIVILCMLEARAQKVNNIEKEYFKKLGLCQNTIFWDCVHHKMIGQPIA